VKKIPLTKGYYAIVDDDDYERVSQFKWTYSKGYAVRSVKDEQGRWVHQLLHRFILNAPEELKVDHINGNALDNRKSNLRLCTQKDNSRNSKKPKNNTSGYKGVTYDRRKKKWKAQIKVNYKNIFLGHFDSKHDAARMYNFWAKDLFGEYARLNVIREDEEEIA
jgi:hypothetical protein